MKHTFGYFLVGAGLGCGAALLLAPEPGRRLRARIRNKAVSGMDYVKDSTVDICGQTTDFVTHALDVAKKSSEAIDLQRCGIKAAVEAGRRAYNKIVSA
jgi:gas vesicle protein